MALAYCFLGYSLTMANCCIDNRTGFLQALSNRCDDCCCLSSQAMGTDGGVEKNDMVKIYRFFNSKADDHMYKSATTPEPGYVLEEFTSFYLLKSKAPGTIPLFQFTDGIEHVLFTNLVDAIRKGYRFDRLLGYMASRGHENIPGFKPTMLYLYQSDEDELLYVDDAVFMSSYGYRQKEALGYVWNWNWKRVVVPYCKATQEDICSQINDYLPLVTHWSNGHFAFLGRDKVDLYNHDLFPNSYEYVPGRCYPTYNIGYPKYESYLCSNYACTTLDKEDVDAMLKSACNDTGISVDLLPPLDPEGESLVEGHLESDSCRVQIIHANIQGQGLVTVFLPPTWRENAAEGTYPIIFNSFYDLNENVFSVYGPFLARLVAQSGVNGRRGVIGVLTNGAGVGGSRGFDEQLLKNSAKIIDWIAKRFHGNRYEVITFGGSRGGYTALAVASNPMKFNYRVILSVAIAPPVNPGTLAFQISPTYPAIYYLAEADLGFRDSWKKGWTYPSCAGNDDMTGLDVRHSLCKVWTGTDDPDLADSQFGLGSKRYIEGLKQGGTQIYIEITDHDEFIPYFTQAKYLSTLYANGLAVEGHVLIRNGHAPMKNKRFETLKKAVSIITSPDYRPTGIDDPIQPLITPSLHIWTADKETGNYVEIQPKFYPFSFDGPYKVARGQRFPLTFVGEVGTEYKLTFKDKNKVYGTIEGKLSTGTQTVWLNGPMCPPGGPYEYVLAIRRPGESKWLKIPPTNTPSGDRAVFWVMEKEPVEEGFKAMDTFSPPRSPFFPTTNWGLSEY